MFIMFVSPINYFNHQCDLWVTATAAAPTTDCVCKHRTLVLHSLIERAFLFRISGSLITK